MLGIGLGAFVGGVERGYGLGQRIEEDNFRSAERARLVKNRDEIAAIDTEARGKFDAGVTSGQYKPEDFDKFWTEFALPKRVNTLLKQGDVAAAEAYQKWGEGEDARNGARLFGSALLKSQTGDLEGAFADLAELGKINGYAQGYSLDGYEPITDAEGKPLGFRLKIKGPDGKVTEQDVAPGDLPRLISTFASPDAAFASQQAAAAAGSKRRADLEDYETKKAIDLRYSDKGAGDDQKRRTDAIKALRDRMDGGLGGDEPSFDSLGREEQEKLILEEIALQTGGAPAGAVPGLGMPGRDVVVDTNTGTPVPLQAPQDVPGLGAQAGPDAKQPRFRPQPAAAPEPEPRLKPEPGTGAQPQTQAQARQALIDEAARVMREGGDPQEIARRMQAAGIPSTLWPGAPGLGL